MWATLGTRTSPSSVGRAFAGSFSVLEATGTVSVGRGRRGAQRRARAARARGVVLVENARRAAGSVLALRIPRSLTTAESIRLTLSGRIQSAGAPTDFVGVLSAGTSNRVRVHVRPGRYLLVSLTGDLVYGTT